MKRFELGRSVGGVMVVVLLAGCGASRPPIGTPGLLVQSHVAAPSVERDGSWMAPEAKSEDLLYISDAYGVHVFSYPKGRHVGDIYGFSEPEGLCSNRAGDVFVTDSSGSRVYEYAHGGTQRLESLYDNSVDFGPHDCSVDPTTGNLAVASADSTFVVIFLKAKQNPKAYYEDMFTYMFFCGYDNKGDLFVDQVFNNSRGHRKYIGELPRGTSEFKNYLLDFLPGGIQFDGRYVTVEGLKSLIVYRLRFSGTKAIVVGTTALKGPDYIEQYWIEGKTLIGPGANESVYFWKYPEGGSPISSIEGFSVPVGSTVSTGR